MRASKSKWNKLKSAENRYKRAEKVFPISLGAQCRGFKSLLRNQICYRCWYHINNGNFLFSSCFRCLPHENGCFPIIFGFDRLHRPIAAAGCSPKHGFAGIAIVIRYGMTVGVLIIYRAANQTVMFEKVDYIRVELGVTRKNWMSIQLYRPNYGTESEIQNLKSVMQSRTWNSPMHFAYWTMQYILISGTSLNRLTIMALRTIWWKKESLSSRTMVSLLSQIWAQFFWQNDFLTSLVFPAKRFVWFSIKVITDWKYSNRSRCFVFVYYPWFVW